VDVGVPELAGGLDSAGLDWAGVDSAGEDGEVGVLADGFGTAAAAVSSGARNRSRLVPMRPQTTRLAVNAITATLLDVIELIATPADT
jgi:hypothetical protein